MAGPVQFKLAGLAGMQARLKKEGKGFKKKIERAMTVVAEKIMTISKRDFVPVDQAILKNSGVVGKVEKKGKEFRIEMGYGGAAEAYALKQHEDLTLQHTVGGPKYLERPLKKFPAQTEIRALIKL